MQSGLFRVFFTYPFDPSGPAEEALGGTVVGRIGTWMKKKDFEMVGPFKAHSGRWTCFLTGGSLYVSFHQIPDLRFKM